MEQAWYINVFRTIFPLVTSPLIGLLTGYTKRHKLVLVSLIFNVIVIFSAPWLALLLTEENLTSDTLFENITWNTKVICTHRLHCWNFLAGALIDVYESKPFLKKYTAIFFCHVSFGILSCLNVCLFNTKKTKSETSRKTSMRFLCRELIKTFQDHVLRM